MSAGLIPGGGRKLKVLYSFPHALGAPGIGWTAWNQANELVRAGHEVHIVAASITKPVEGAASVRTTLDAVLAPRAASGTRARSRSAPARPFDGRDRQEGRRRRRPRLAAGFGAAPSRRQHARGIPALREVPEHAHRARLRGGRPRNRDARPGAAPWREPHARRTTPRDRGTRMGGRDGAAGSVGGGRADVPRSRIRAAPAVAPPVRLECPSPARSAGRPAVHRRVPRTRRTPQGVALCASGLARLDGVPVGTVPRLRRARP